MKAAAHHIKGLNETKWKPFARKTMEKACLLKFTQNQDLKSKLLSSQGTLVEANRRDTYFSCGISLSDPNILDRSKWLGENMLGRILTQLRETLKGSE